MGESRTDVIHAFYVSSSLLALIDAEAAIGRSFSVEENVKPSESVVLSHSAWIRFFGGRPDIVGRNIRVGLTTPEPGTVRAVIGVLKPETVFPGQQQPDILLPLGDIAATAASFYESNRFLRAIAKRRADVPLGVAEAAAIPLVRGSASPDQLSARLTRLSVDQAGVLALPLIVVLSAAGVLLLVACLTVAGLLFLEGYIRSGEVAVRRALGCGKLALIHQLAGEYGSIAAAGISLGILGALWVKAWILRLAPSAVPISSSGLDPTVTVLAVAAVAVTMLLFSVGPVLIHSSGAPARRLAGTRALTTAGGFRSSMTVAATVALAFMLVALAGAFGESIFRLSRTPVGFDRSRLTVLTVKLTEYGLKPAQAPTANTGADQVANRLDELGLQMRSGWLRTAGAVDALKALPSVSSVAGVTSAPFSGGVGNTVVVRAAGDATNVEQLVLRQFVTDTYFETMRIALREGRGFTVADRSSPAPAIVSRRLQNEVFGGSAVGKQLIHEGVVHEVIGVVDDVSRYAVGENALATFYLLEQVYGWINHFVIRSDAPPSQMVELARARLASYDPHIVVISSSSMEELVHRATGPQNMTGYLATSIGVTALVFCGVAMYALLTERVGQRRREIAIRVALGAAPWNVYRFLLGDIGISVIAGVAAGIPLTYLALWWVESLLYGVGLRDIHLLLWTAAAMGTGALAVALKHARDCWTFRPGDVKD